MTIITEKVEVSIDLEVWCDVCGAELEAELTRNRSLLGLDVKPCKWCIEDAQKEGREEKDE